MRRYARRDHSNCGDRSNFECDSFLVAAPFGAPRSRQARYVGRTKTLFQVCLAAAVANLTLVAATSNPWLGSGLEVLGWSLVILAATLSLSRPHLDVAIAALVNSEQTHLDQLTHPWIGWIGGGVPRSLSRR